MEKVKYWINWYKEFCFQLILHLVVFVFYVFDSTDPDIGYDFEFYQMIFFFNYAVANAVVSYVLLPHFYYKKKYISFIALAIVTIGVVIILEETVLEKMFFQDSRGSHFPGIIFSLAQVLPIITILSGFKFAWDALVKQRKVEELEAMVRESELVFLKSQINPHFLFNNLNNLYAYAIEGSSKTPAIILELSAVLRYMLYECREKSVPLTKEIDHLKNFTQLYELQIEERGMVRFKTENIKSEYQIEPLILNVFIENAFKHSQAGQSEGILIDIFIKLSADGRLSFGCKNNFRYTSHTDDTSKGIGLENVKKRLQLLYPKTHQLKIEQTQNHYEVNLSIQLNKTHR